MDILKVKVWDIKGRRWVEPTLISLKQKTLSGIVERNKNGEWSSVYRFDQVEFVNPTGLVDKNGVEIYEGDIVSCFREGLSIVEFKESTFGLVTRDKFTPFYEVGGYCEVIGNIYENSDLLATV